MNTTTFSRLLAALVLSLFLVPAFALAANATSSGASSEALNAATATRMANLKSRADQELDRRTKNIEAVAAKAADIKNLPQSGVAAIQTTLQNNLTALSALKAKIDSDVDLATLRSDVQQITGSYHIYALVVPQLRIIVAADHVVTVAGKLHALSLLLAERVSAAEAAGADMTAAKTSLTDLDARITAAATGAQDAVTAIGSLQPDATSTTPFGNNLATLQNARAKVVEAQKDIAAARADAGAIVAAVKGKPLTAPRASSTPAQ